jgi:hypothetical protein
MIVDFIGNFALSGAGNGTFPRSHNLLILQVLFVLCGREHVSGERNFDYFGYFGYCT